MARMLGQYFSFDAIIATIIFLLTFLALFSYWTTIKAGMGEERDFMLKEAIRISYALLTPDIKNGGIAESWQERKVVPKKLTYIRDKIRERLNTPYNIYVRIYVAHGGSQTWDAGIYPRKAKNIAKITRVVSIKISDNLELPGIMEVFVYR